jgi:hypothetical protein
MEKRMGRIGRIQTDFSGVRVLKIREKLKKNPCQSARSAPSVLPLYPKSTFRCVYDEIE